MEETIIMALMIGGFVAIVAGYIVFSVVKKRMWGIVIILIGCLAFVGSYSLIPQDGTNSNSSSTSTIECQVCGREFLKGSDNAKSIRKTNMCTQCYSNYKGASDALNELPQN